MAGLLVLSLLSGCAATADRVVYLGNASTKTVRLREAIKDAKVWYKDSTGVSLPGVSDLAEGGYYRSDLN